MRVPTIHLNGTSGSTLMDEYLAAYEALVKARDAVLTITVHGRDYYVQKDNPIQEAIREKYDMVEVLNDKMKEIADVLIAIDDQTRFFKLKD